MVELENEVDRVQSELDHAADRFHMAKLTEALREFDNDEPPKTRTTSSSTEGHLLGPPTWVHGPRNGR